MRHEEFHQRYPLSEEAFRKLSLYHDLLLKWQKHINLIASSTANDVWERHILDSLQLLKYLQAFDTASPGGRASHELAEQSAMRKSEDFRGRQFNIADIGSGAGFPGLMLAICNRAPVTLIESDRKKCEFLREAARVTGTLVEILQTRAENLTARTFDILVSRATAPLEILFDWAFPLMQKESICLFHKGENWAKEIETAKKCWAFDVETLPSESSVTGCIIKATNLTKRQGVKR